LCTCYGFYVLMESYEHQRTKPSNHFEKTTLHLLELETQEKLEEETKQLREIVRVDGRMFGSSSNALVLHNPDLTDVLNSTLESNKSPFPVLPQRLVDLHGPQTVDDLDPAPDSKNCPFIDFPQELVDEIFAILDPVESACLGLSCKRFYIQHRKLHGTVALATQSVFTCYAPKCYHVYDPIDKRESFYKLGTLLTLGGKFMFCGVCEKLYVPEFPNDKCRIVSTSNFQCLLNIG